MTRKLVFGLAILAGIAVAGCKDDRPTPMKFDPKGGYSGQPQYKGAGTQQGTAAGTGSTTP